MKSNPITREDLASQIGKNDTAMVIGRVDTGKSTLIKFLVSRLNAALVDADIGQSDVGPPTVISLGRKRLSDDKLELIDGYFVGSTTPARHLLQMLVGTKKMVERASRPIIVNTTGMVDGPIGRALKSRKIETINPDLLILLERDRELDYYGTYENAGIDVLRMDVSPEVMTKSRNERKLEREKAFKANFAGARNLSVELAKYGLKRTLLGSGSVIDPEQASRLLDCRVLRAEKTGSEVLAIVEGRAQGLEKACRTLEAAYIEIADRSSFENLLVGLVDHSGNFIGLGILNNIDYRSMLASLYTVVERFANIQFGALKLSFDCIEMGWYSSLHYRPE